LSAENRSEAAASAPDPPTLPDRASALALAAGLRASLRLHQQLGIQRYPLTPGLHGFLNAKHGVVGARQRPPAAVAPPVHVKKTASSVAKTAPASAAATTSGDQLLFLQRDLAECRLCPLASARQGLTPGSGVAGARLMVVGGCSRQTQDFAATTLFGAAEDAMLWNMVRAMGLAAVDVYVTNAVKCCPLGDQLPAESEQACRGHLRREIALVRPQVVLAMGDAAARAVLGSLEPASRLRGRFHRFGPSDAAGEGVPVMVTFHPQFLLAQPEMKKAVWDDLQQVQRRLIAPEGAISGKTL